MRNRDSLMTRSSSPAKHVGLAAGSIAVSSAVACVVFARLDGLSPLVHDFGIAFVSALGIIPVALAKTQTAPAPASAPLAPESVHSRAQEFLAHERQLHETVETALRATVQATEDWALSLAEHAKALLELGTAELPTEAEPVSNGIEAARFEAALRSLERDCEAERETLEAARAAALEQRAAMAAKLSAINERLQMQDILRQRLDRALSALAQRNAALVELPPALTGGPRELESACRRLDAILDEFVALEERHAPCSPEKPELSRIELF